MGAGAAAGGGGALQAIAAFNSAMQEKEMHKFNARFQKGGRENAKRRGRLDKQRVSLGERQLTSRQRVGFADQGVALDSGSALTVQQDTARMAELDRIEIENNTANEVWGFDVQIAESNFKAKQARKKAYNSLILGAASAASAYGTPGAGAQIGGGGGSIPMFTKAIPSVGSSPWGLDNTAWWKKTAS